MPTAPDATLLDEAGRAVLRFERRLPHPPERVWRALTDPGEQAAWHPTPFRLEGTTVRYLDGFDVPGMADGAVLEHDPPRRLVHTWDEDLVRWELHPDGDGTRLVLEHVFDDRMKAARDGAGWHVCLDTLRASLAGEEPSRANDDPSKPWEPLNVAYEQRFGIDPADAAPIPES